MNWAFPLFLIYTYFRIFSRFFFIAFLNPLPNCLQQFAYFLKNFPFFSIHNYSSNFYNKVSKRDYTEPDSTFKIIGFRVVQTVKN